MSNPLLNDLKKIKEINQSSMAHKDNKTVLPFLLIDHMGNYFFSTGLSKNSVVNTMYFALKEIDEKIKCATLELLQPFPPMKCSLQPIPHSTKLYRTKAVIQIDLTHFCGLSIQEIPVLDYRVTTTVHQTVFRFPLKLNRMNTALTLWHNDRKQMDHTATIICHNAGRESLQIEIKLTDKTFVESIPASSSKAMTVRHLTDLRILQSKEESNGFIEIHLNEKIKKKIYY